MRVALVHDWLVTYRGGEKVLAAIAELYPGADLFTLIHTPGPFPQILENRPIHTSFLQRVPGINRRYRYFLPLFPAAVGSLDLRGFDLVISSSHCAAKGVRKPPGARHLSYVHAPMRYMWDRFDDYFGKGRASWPTRAAARLVRPALQSWDRTSSDGVDRFLANSDYVAQKIADLYGRQAQVVPPPVELERFAALPPNGGGQGGYFLSVGALAPYKRLDIAIEAFRRLKLPLWVVGSGQEGPLLWRASVDFHCRRGLWNRAARSPSRGSSGDRASARWSPGDAHPSHRAFLRATNRGLPRQCGDRIRFLGGRLRSRRSQDPGVPLHQDELSEALRRRGGAADRNSALAREDRPRLSG